MNTYIFDLFFNSEADLKKFLETILEKHEDGIRSLYHGEVVWAVETQQNAYEKEITLKSIKTWRHSL